MRSIALPCLENGKASRMYQADNTDCVAIISGGTKGLGLAIAHQLVARGCRQITLTGRNRQDGEKAAAEIEAAGAECHFQPCDAAQPDQCRAVIDETLARFGRVNALVNAAADTSRGSLLDAELADFDRHIHINLRAPFLLMQGVARHLCATGQPGSMVNILSTSAYVGQSFLAAYSASKGGLMTLTRNAAQALRANRIRVNAVAPGWMDTPGEDIVQRQFHGGGDDWLEKAEASMPFGQLAKPGQIAPLVAWLLSPQAGIITGAVIDYDQQIVGQMPE